MMVTDNKAVFRTHVHNDIEHLVKYGQSHFAEQDYNHSKKNNFTEDYHFTSHDASVDIYCTAVRRANLDYKIVKLQYHTSIGVSSIDFEEINTEFTKKIYDKIKARYARQHVK